MEPWHWQSPHPAPFALGIEPAQKADGKDDEHHHDQAQRRTEILAGVTLLQGVTGSGKTFTMENGIKMQAVSGQKAGIKLIGGGTLKLACDVSAINGTVSVVEDSTLNLGSSWVSNAEVVSVEAGSSVVTEGAIELNGGSQIVLGIASATDFAKIEGASLTSDDGSFGSLVFDVDSAAFGEGNSLTLDLANLVDAGVVDWSKFDITAVGYDVSLNGSQVTIAVPEPAEYAAFFGALALFAALYRRAKRS